MVDHGNFLPVVNHYRWFVETLAHIASIYLIAQIILVCIISITHLETNVKCFFILRGGRGMLG